MFNEYAAAKNLIIITKVAFNIDVDIIDVSRIISLIKLIEGGAAIFHAVNKNHHIVSVGQIVISPFVKYMLRV
jgi:hypothetical protein